MTLIALACQVSTFILLYTTLCYRVQYQNVSRLLLKMIEENSMKFMKTYIVSERFY